jgi:imidazolonepropionase-like amidohydrolase
VIFPNQYRLFSQRMARMKLLNAHLIDGTGAKPMGGAALIFDEWVNEIRMTEGLSETSDSETLDVAGRTVIPGLVNAHVHITLDPNAPDVLKAVRDEQPPVTALRAAERARRMLEAGITTARDLGGRDYIELGVRDLIQSGEIPGPRLLCAGKVITMTGGTAWVIGRECDGEDEIRKGVREQIKAGADLIKLMATGGVLTPGVEPGSPQLTESELRAGIEEAHKANRSTSTHAQGLEGIKAAIRAGIDTIEHGIFLDDEAVAMMVEKEVVFVPTLAAAYRLVQSGPGQGVPKFVKDKMDRLYEAHQKSFRLAWEAGVIIAAGNDGGTPFNPQEDLVTEIRLMIEAGVPVLEAIRAGTLNSAQALGLDREVGSLAIGKKADLVVLDGNPLNNPTTLSQIWCVIQGGDVVYRRHA